MKDKCYLCGRDLDNENFIIKIDWENKTVHRTCYLKLKFYKTYKEMVKNVLEIIGQNSRIYE